MGGWPSQDLTTAGLVMAAVDPDPRPLASGISSMATVFEFNFAINCCACSVLVSSITGHLMETGSAAGTPATPPTSSTPPSASPFLQIKELREDIKVPEYCWAGSGHLPGGVLEIHPVSAATQLDELKVG
ncbi:unnamed protein product [Urochloa humidicola]